MNFEVDAASAPRSGTVTIAGQTLFIHQGSAPPEVATINTGSSGMSETLLARFDHPDGASRLTVVNLLINQYLDGRRACYLAYDAAGGVLYLVKDDGGEITGAMMGRPGTLRNGQCAIDVGASAATIAGSSLSLSLRIEYLAGFAGRKVVWGAARDIAGQNSGWVPKSVRHVPPAVAPAPRALHVTPLHGSGTSGQFTITYANTGGGASFHAAQLLINSAIDGRNACYLGYDRIGNVLYLLNDEGTALLVPGIVPNTGTGILENTRCRINSSGLTMSETGDTLTLAMTITFKSAFNGPRILFTGVQSAQGNSGWEAMASWVVP